MTTLDIWRSKEGILRWDGGDLTGDLSADDYSMLIPVIGDRMSIQLVIASGDADGEFYFQEVQGPDLTPVSMAVPVVSKVAAAALNAVVTLTDLSSQYIRVFWDRTSGGAAQTVAAYVSQGN